MHYAKLKSYSEAYQYLCKFTDYERMAKVHYSQTTYNLKRMKRLLETIDNPQDNLRCIHIAGTKGKGSTAIMLATILSGAGYRVGLYTSPHLVDLRERIQVWHKDTQTLISKNDFTNLMNRITNGLNNQHLKPTFFELMTALGFLHFAGQEVDFAVIEVGLGGRLDATNLITPIVSVITRIDLDHMDKLGHTIKEIAREKAGIIKENVPVITFKQRTSADKVIRERAKKQRAPLHIVKIGNHKFKLLGYHQKENYSLAADVIKLLNSKGYTKINQKETNNDLRSLVLPARLELVSRNPDIIIDSAHNAVSIKTTVESIKHLKYRNIILIFALSKDKNIKKILNLIIPAVDVIILTKTHHPRLLEPEEMLNRACPEQMLKQVQYDSFGVQHDIRVGFSPPILLAHNHYKALNMAKTLAHKEDLILITGSFYLAGPVRDMFKKTTEG